MNISGNAVTWGLIGLAGVLVVGRVMGAKTGPVSEPTISTGLYQGTNAIAASKAGGIGDAIYPSDAKRLEAPIMIRRNPPPEASVTPIFSWQVGITSGTRAPITKGESGINGITGSW